MEKKFLEEIRKGKQADLEGFGADICDLLDWGIANSFVEGISYLGFGGKISIQYTNPRLTETGEAFLTSLENSDEELLVKPFDTEVLIDKIRSLDESQQKTIDLLSENSELLDEISDLDEQSLGAMKGILMKLRIEDEEKKIPWGTLIKLVSLLK